MAVILIGFMGSGKSRVGRELARLLACPFVDLDARIEEAAGCSIPALFREHGEAEFRHIEGQELRRALQEDSVLSTGGGIVTQPENRKVLHLSGAPVIWLQATPQVLAERIRSEPGARPLIDGGGHLDMDATIARVSELLEARAPFYEACATLRLDTGGRAPEEIAAEIAGLIDNL